MDKKQGKPGRKIFRDHIVLRGKFVKKYKACECLVFFGCVEETPCMIKSFLTRLYCHCDNCMVMEKNFLYLTILLGREHLYLK